jgi:hypothetical protein
VEQARRRKTAFRWIDKVRISRSGLGTSRSSAMRAFAGKDPAPSLGALTMAAVISPASRSQEMQRGDLETRRMVQTRSGTRSGCLSKYSRKGTPAPRTAARARGPFHPLQVKPAADLSHFGSGLPAAGSNPAAPSCEPGLRSSLRTEEGGCPASTWARSAARTPTPAPCTDAVVLARDGKSVVMRPAGRRGRRHRGRRGNGRRHPTVAQPPPPPYVTDKQGRGPSCRGPRALSAPRAAAESHRQPLRAVQMHRVRGRPIR